ncbi:MAG: glutathione S-transferase family protein [Betaproteobacteria bacterium]
MKNTYTLYGWHLSYFTGKALCYLRFKQVPFVLQQVNMLTLTRRIKRKTGAVVMPVMVTPQGQWIQDTSRIIDHIEARFPDPSIIPATPVQRFAAYLFEAWGDEWWVPIAMHTRWSYPENYALFERDAGTALLPWLPGFMQRLAARKVANKLRAMLHKVGVRSEQFDVMNAWTQGTLDQLDEHFKQSSFLLGDTPTLADFGLVGTMVAHLGRDPWPARELVAPRPHLRAWIDRMAGPTAPTGASAALLANDRIAPTLEPILRAVFNEFLPLLQGINEQAKALLPTLPAGRGLPRTLKDVEVPMGDGRFRRAAMPYTLWMAQRTLDVYRAMTPVEQRQVRDWLRPLGGEGFLELDIPRLRLHALRVHPDSGAA